jgi:aminoglycoside phosphotransferase (APT) family kinase protein
VSLPIPHREKRIVMTQAPLPDQAAFARRLLAIHGLPTEPLTPANGWSNHVWMTDRHVVRISSGRFRGAYAHEAAVLALLPPAVPHASVLARGQVGAQEWMLLTRVPGQPLGQVWSTLSEQQRRSAIRQLGAALEALHATAVPDGFVNPWLDAALTPGGSPRDAYHAPPAHYPRLLDAARAVPGVDQQVLDAAEAALVSALPHFANDRPVLMHGDMHFANLLWHDDALTALLDFEGARLAPPDQELDTLLRYVREPALFRSTPGERVAEPGVLAGVPEWLAEAYPALFAHPRLAERLRAYDILWQLVQLLHFPPGSGLPDPWAHLVELVEATR